MSAGIIGEYENLPIPIPTRRVAPPAIDSRNQVGIMPLLLLCSQLGLVPAMRLGLLAAKPSQGGTWENWHGNKK